MTKRILILFLLCVIASLASSAPSPNYRVRNTELGVVYRPPSVRWDGQQWDSIFADPAPPMGWVFLPIGKESCNAFSSSWLSKAKAKGFRLGVVLVPFLDVNDIKKTVDCSAAHGFRRAVLDEYISYQTQNLGRPICTVLSEVRSVYEYTKNRHPSFQFDIDDNWQTWIALLGRGQSDACGTYPYFRVDQSGVSVLSKYGNPAQNACGHPTAAEIHEQLQDLRPVLRDYSRSGKTFAWQLNQNWYPGKEETLQIFRLLKPVYGFEPFLLYGPTSTSDGQDNWGYRAKGGGENCSQNQFEWYLPARDYLIRLREGRKTFLTLQGPSNVGAGSSLALRGRLKTTVGVPGMPIELQVVPPVGSRQLLTREVVAPDGARVAFLGVRVNNQVPRDIKGSADLLLHLVQLFEHGNNSNKVGNPDFNDGLSKWVSVSSASVSTVTDGSDKSVRIISNPQQGVSITSVPVFVSGGRTYTVSFHAKLFSQSRNNAYFFVAWNSLSDELRRDRMYLKFPDRQTIAATGSRRDGTFSFSYQPMEPGLHTVFAFFRGTRGYQPSVISFPLAVN